MNFDNFNVYFAVAELLYLIALMPNIFALFKNKNSLIGFSCKGALLSSTGLILYVIGFIQLDMIINALITIPTIIYWVSVVYYNKNQLKCNI